MTPKRAAAWTLVAALAAAWLASAAGVIGQPPTRRPPVRPQLSAETEAISFDVQAQAARLRQRLATAPAPHPVRNPFTFEARQSMPKRTAAPSAGLPPPAPPIAPPDIDPVLTLIGVAEDSEETGVVRTAMIVGVGDELFLVRVGQSVGRYQVVAIGADAVELKDSASDRVRRLGLR